MMKKYISGLMACAVLLFYSCSAQSQNPSVETFKQVFEAQMQKLRSEGYTKRTISFVEVIPGKPNGGYYPFKIKAYIHDYAPGYPPNRYYGQTCLGFMDGWKFDMLKDEFGEWIVQGMFTQINRECKDNAAEGAVSIAVPGTPYKKPATPAKTAAAPPKAPVSQLYIGEYACYGTGGRMMTGMGFTLLPGGKYYDLDKQRGGTYVYDSKNATITFKGGFLSGQVGKNVKQTGFQISSTVNAEPWR